MSGHAEDLKANLPWIWTGFVGVASLGLFLVGGYDAWGNEWSVAMWLLLPALYTGLGALIVTRRPGNRIAWVLFLVGFAIILDGAAQPFIETAPTSPTLVDYVALFVANFTWIAIFFPLFLLLYIFPTGRFLARHWSWAGVLAMAMFTVFIIGGGFAEAWGSPNDDWMIENPIGFIPNSVVDSLFGVAWSLGLIVLPLCGFLAMAVRFRRSDIVERAQIKWVMYAALVLALSYVASVVLGQLFNGAFAAQVIGTLFVMSIALLPLSTTAAIVRYRLFEIDRVISRTLAYAIVVAVLGAFYLGMVTLVTSVLPSQNALAVAGSTLAVAAPFNPLRKRTQHLVDKHFNRSGYQAEAISEEFRTRLRESLTNEQLADLWTQTITRALQPKSTGIWVSAGTTPGPDHKTALR